MPYRKHIYYTALAGAFAFALRAPAGGAAPLRIIPSEPVLEMRNWTTFDQSSELAGKVLEVAQFYEKNKNRKAAKVYFEKVVNDYPETEAAKEAGEKIK